MAWRQVRETDHGRFRAFDISVGKYGVRDTETGKVVRDDFTDSFSAQYHANELNENPPADDE